MKNITKDSKQKRELFLVLHNIRSVQNVGAIFRTADAVGVTKVYLSGYTPAPLDRFARVRADFIKASLGSEKFVPWETKDIAELLVQFKNEGVWIAALEQDKYSIDYKTFKPNFPVAVILGNEVDGVSRDILDKCDSILEIPMRGEKESLNVSVATGIVLYRLLDQEN